MNMSTCSSRRGHASWFALVACLPVIACTALFANAAEKAEKPKKSSTKSSSKPDKFSIVKPENARGELLAKLRKPVSFEWMDVPLPEALAQLKEGTKVTFTVNEEDVRKNDLDPQAKVSGNWKDRPAEDVLGEILSRAKLDYIVDGEKLVVVSPRSATIAPVTLTYNVKGLCRDAASLGRLKQAVFRAGPEFEWEQAGGFASVTEDASQRTLAIKHTWSRHAAIRNAMRKFGSDK